MLSPEPVQVFYKCPICDASNPFVNRCGCDKDNLPTRPLSNRQRFLAVYTEALTETVKAHPEEYAWPVANVPIVVERMAAAMDRGSFNHNSRSYRLTCKRLGIPYTRKSILAFWKGGAR